MSETPRTDAALCIAPRSDPPAIINLRPFGHVVCADFARMLERELAHALRDQTLFKSDTPNNEQLAILDVINALRAVVAALKPRIINDGTIDLGTIAILSLKDAETLLNLLSDAEAKLQLP